MYIEPKTNVKILKNIPLDNTYTNTILFTNRSDQYNFFSSKIKYNLTNYTYQRVKRGWMRVGISAENLYDCNYLMFQNTSFGDKWFYAFITSVEYVNNECTEIEFEIDCMQTWNFDYSLKHCFVAREHVTSDNIGEHLLPEPVELSEYIYNDYTPVHSMNEMAVIVSVCDTDGESRGTAYDGIYGGATLFAFNGNDYNGVNGVINNYIQRPDAIVSIYMLPKFLIGDIPSGEHILPATTSAKIVTKEIPAISTTDTLKGYKPKNNKLYTYPYNFLSVDNSCGSSLALRYEFFQNLTPVLEINGTITQPVSVGLRPCSYKGLRGYDSLGGYASLNTELLQLSSYPICSWNVDSYQAWIAQNAVPLALQSATKLINNGINMGAIGGVGSMVGVGSTLVNEVGSTLSQYYTASIQADQCRGSFNNGGVNVVAGKQQFYYGRCCITPECAKSIDNFFDMFGYTCNLTKIPNRKARPHWSYVQTKGCIIGGSIPSDDERTICEIYNKGITFWVKGNEVGNYSLDNRLT